jgi:tryptophan 2,3-dioxygenase
MNLTHDILNRLDQLDAKYAAMGQDMQSYLDGLLYADYLTYWDYIHIDTLLSLQNTRTPIPDERIFIIYHQITELYFRLILDALEVICVDIPPSVDLFIRQIERVNRYFEQLIQSYDIMVDGLDKDEFLRFRMSLLPSSGFQSAQFRMIEIMSTDFKQLLHHTQRTAYFSENDMVKIYDGIYWKYGATELATGKKTLTLKQFEVKYSKLLIDLAERVKHFNVHKLYQNLPESDKNNAQLRGGLKDFDVNINVRWRLSHYRSAVRHLERKPDMIAATGGTNWQQYLPPKNQRIVFFPELWSEDELNDWGKRVKFGI